MHAFAPATLRLAAGLPGHALPLLRHVALAALEGTLFILAVWVICRLAPRLPAGLRCTLWWLASFKLVLGLLWPAPLPLPLLPAALAAPPARSRPAAAPFTAGGAASASAPSAAPPATPAAAGRSAPSPAASGGPVARWWATAVAAAWLLGVAFQLGALAREWWMLRQLLKRTWPVEDETVRRLAAGICRRLGLPPVELRLLAPAPEPARPAGPARETALRRGALPAPLIAGALRPVVVLPAASLSSLSPEEAAMTLCHELMHVRRRDLLWCWMPAIAQRLFFFLPLAKWAAREYAVAREAACDDAVLRLLGAAPVAYGRLLLRLAVAPPGRDRTAYRAERWPAATTVASAASSLQQLKRRLEMLQQFHDHRSRPRGWRRLGFAALGLLAFTALVPLRLVPVPPARPAAPACSSAARVPGLADGIRDAVHRAPDEL
jgi:bla regulator protein BlaR1